MVLQRPFLSLKNGIVDGSEDDNTLLISFDQLSHDVKQYSYTIKHLNYDWTLSDISSYEYIEGFIEAKQQQLMGLGRVLVRLSGTEPLIRVMVEGESLEKITAVANDIVNKIKERLATIGA